MPKNKKWYDVDCKSLYRKIRSLVWCIKKSPLNVHLLHQYHDLKKKYKKLLNVKKLAFRAIIFDMLDTVKTNNPREFWDFFRQLCDDKKSKDKYPIYAKQWWDHFSTLMNKMLLSSDSAFDDLINNFGENHTTSNHELDVDITVDKIIKAELNLKNKKAPGFDGFRNEMLKVLMF